MTAVIQFFITQKPEGGIQVQTDMLEIEGTSEGEKKAALFIDDAVQRILQEANTISRDKKDEEATS